MSDVALTSLSFITQGLLLDRVPDAAESVSPTGSLLGQVARVLEAHGVSYCQWKGHWSAHRWTAGNADVDLLVDHAAMVEFRGLMDQLGFKRGLPPGERQIPGIESYVGYDPAVARLLHLHVHYRLLLGDYWKPVYRLPVERAILDAAVAGDPFRVPTATHKFFIFVLRMMLRQLGRPLLSTQTRWLAGIQPPLASLEAACDHEELASFLRRHLPSLDPSFFIRCARSLRGESGMVERALLPWLLARKLRANARRPPFTALITAAAEKLLPQEITDALVDSRMRLPGGGAVIALIGGDGAGKSTCARELTAWLSPVFPTMRVHLGNPPRSLLTLAVGGALGLQRLIARRFNRRLSSGHTLELLRHVCIARDRHLLYVKVHRFATSGGIAICERYPIGEDLSQAGAGIPGLLPAHSGRLGKTLKAIEAAYYERMLRPDTICVLRLDPELAVLRKPEEPADDVRARSKAIWQFDWSARGAHVIDASQPQPEVVRDLKSVLWRIL
jgi:thymidylate kinase